MTASVTPNFNSSATFKLGRETFDLFLVASARYPMTDGVKFVQRSPKGFSIAQSRTWKTYSKVHLFKKRLRLISKYGCQQAI